MTIDTFPREVVYQPSRIFAKAPMNAVILGQPRVDDGAVFFDGVADGIILDENPLRSVGRFRIDAEFAPASGGAAEQRFFHIQSTTSTDRLLLEIRVTPDGQWFADSFFSCGDAFLVLQDSACAHPLNHWYRYTLVYDGTMLEQRIDGRFECSGRMPGAQTPDTAVTSIGIRANGAFPFCGAVRSVRISTELSAPASVGGA
ncbi:MAG: hypothetical protein EA403_15075 [Spirochaetaceae bacterium]|nr:MAG: hypothetical protein EA403_15075 [Spirochaetaceae bacterium]